MKEELEYSLLQLKLAKRYESKSTIFALQILTDAFNLDQLRKLDRGGLLPICLN